MRKRKRGVWGTPTRIVWQNMKDRCRNPNHPQFKDYGGRGIQVCQRWLDNFQNFLADMGEKPSNLSIDRIDNDGNYEPENCQWSPRRRQNRNTRRTKWITYNGQTKCMADWAEEFKMHPAVLWSRLKRGWTTERALAPRNPAMTAAEKCRAYRLRKKANLAKGVACKLGLIR